jgi:hypothetical protein
MGLEVGRLEGKVPKDQAKQQILNSTSNLAMENLNICLTIKPIHPMAEGVK